MIIVGLDFSISETGFACTGHDGEPAGMCVIKSSSKKGQTDTERFHHHVDNIMDMFTRNAPEPKQTVIMIEDYAFSAQGQITRIAECCGILKHSLYRAGYPPDQLVAVAPSMLKKFTTGSGNAQKDLMLLMAYKRWGVESTNNNEVDAFALMQLGMLLQKDFGSLTKYEQEMLSKLIATNKKDLGEMAWLSRLLNGNRFQAVTPPPKKPRKRKSSPELTSLKGVVDVESLETTQSPSKKQHAPTHSTFQRRKN